MNCALAGICLALWTAAQAGRDPDQVVTLDPVIRAVPETISAEQVRDNFERALGWLLEQQHEDGSWGSGALEGTLEMGFAVETYYNWQFAAHGLAVAALLVVDETPQVRAALERSIVWMDEAREPKRGSEWDVDYTWSALYGLAAATALSQDARFAAAPWTERIERIGRRAWKILERNEVPSGGWAYYDDPPFSVRPTWATSFCTALVLPSLPVAQKLGWIEDDGPYRRALATLQRACLPTGAYTYDVSNGVQRIRGGEFINHVKGSLGRTQVGNWARAMVGDKTMTLDQMREGLENFFEHHRFLDVARMRPIPHEAYYANAGYFYLFAHFYAAQVIELLPAGEREAWHARLRPHLVKIQEQNGSTVDFLGTSYTRTAGTAMTVYALSVGSRPDE